MIFKAVLASQIWPFCIITDQLRSDTIINAYLSSDQWKNGLILESFEKFLMYVIVKNVQQQLCIEVHLEYVSGCLFGVDLVNLALFDRKFKIWAP